MFDCGAGSHFFLPADRHFICIIFTLTLSKYICVGKQKKGAPGDGVDCPCRQAAGDIFTVQPAGAYGQSFINDPDYAHWHLGFDGGVKV